MLDIIVVKLILYTGPQCSLCDLAIGIVEQFNSLDLASKKGLANQPSHITLEKLNIRNSTELYHLYGARIPVLKKMNDSAELGWPFTIEDLIEFIK